ncbi:hypothetical protein OF122_03120 [Pelagibacterium flavum]|uniref:Lipoprotein n=1 Tax=Pelagibacterium flavum TaxID=2984530 RepID=A0ABY6IQ89_9HYPH|nr:hypothetical protein [Pelagibacterium sp. YIM 151497]MAN77696.1 hypothetical protein [Hyphomicrobiales bacterium]UYQ72784.1 hypothetical protein OF122_03120 [Pelagibacterium sp. YIM 151497]
MYLFEPVGGKVKRTVIVGLAAIILSGCQTVSPETRLKNLRQLCDMSGFSEKNLPQANEVCVGYLVEDAGQKGQISAEDYATLRALISEPR